MSGKSYQIVSSGEARAFFEKLHEDVTRNLERVFITREGSDARCVLISQAELEAMERALDILSGTPEGVAMRAEVLRIATAARSQASVPAGLWS